MAGGRLEGEYKVMGVRGRRERALEMKLEQLKWWQTHAKFNPSVFKTEEEFNKWKQSGIEKLEEEIESLRKRIR